MYVKKIKDFLEWKDKPNFNYVAPNNCTLNIILSYHIKGVSSIYKLLLGKNMAIIEKACENWNEKLPRKVKTFSFKNPSLELVCSI